MSHLKYLNVMKNDSTKHSLFYSSPGQGISFIWIVVRIRFSGATHVFIVSYEIAKRVAEITRGSVMGRYFND